jgi:hypothetical protein
MFQMNFKGIYLIFLNRPKEMFLSLQELTYNHSVPSNPCPIQPRSPLLFVYRYVKKQKWSALPSSISMGQAATASGCFALLLARHSKLIGQTWQRGDFGVHTVAPNSIIAWLKSPGLSGSTISLDNFHMTSTTLWN